MLRELPGIGLESPLRRSRRSCTQPDVRTPEAVPCPTSKRCRAVVDYEGFTSKRSTSTIREEKGSRAGFRSQNSDRTEPGRMQVFHEVEHEEGRGNPATTGINTGAIDAENTHTESIEDKHKGSRNRLDCNEIPHEESPMVCVSTQGLPEDSKLFDPRPESCDELWSMIASPPFPPSMGPTDVADTVDMQAGMRCTPEKKHEASFHSGNICSVHSCHHAGPNNCLYSCQERRSDTVRNSLSEQLTINPRRAPSAHADS